jgi:hypothetical protein
VIIGTEAFTPAIGWSTDVDVILTILPPAFWAQHLPDRELADEKKAFDID